jgi:hypothetical protein
LKANAKVEVLFNQMVEMGEEWEGEERRQEELSSAEV